MTTVTFQNYRKFTCNPINFANEFGESQFFFHLNISFNLSNKYADFKKNMYIQLFQKLKKQDFSCVKKNYLQNFLKSAHSLKVKKGFNQRKYRGHRTHNPKLKFALFPLFKAGRTAMMCKYDVKVLSHRVSRPCWDRPDSKIWKIW